MNCETNRFEELPADFKPPKGADLIPFDLREVVIIKGYRFRIESINIGENRMTLEPLGKVPPRPRPTVEELQAILDAPDDSRDIVINPDGSITVED